MKNNVGINLHYALAYARRGWRVFPLHEVQSGDCSCGRDSCSSAGKHPRTKNGVKDATLDPEQITRWWTQWPTANIGIATGIAEGATSGLYVIDVDTVKGATLESLERCDLSSLRSSLVARTGSGGYHIYLSTEQRLPNTCDRLAPFVDTRGEGGYVVAPPSRNRHGFYAWGENKPLQPVPGALLAVLNQAHKEGGKSEPHALSMHAPVPQAAQVAQATEVDSAQAKEALVHEARNNYLIGMAGRFRGQGLNVSEICALLVALNEARYGAGRHPQGPLSLEELQRTIFKSVAKWEQECGVLAAPQAPEVLRVCDLMSMELPPVNWIVPELLSEGLTLLAGKPKVGKSWLILGLALACSLGTANGGGLALGRYPVEAMGVLYLTLEDNPTRLRNRMLKILGERSVPTNFGYALRWKSLVAGGLADLENYLLNAPDTRLLIIDTLARVRQQSSNSSSLYQEEADLMNALQAFANTHRLALVVVHHLRKMGSDDVFDEVSGTLGLTGGADTTIILKRARYEQEGTLAITGRDVEEQEMAAAFAKESGHWTITGKVEEEQRRGRSEIRQSIIDLLRKKGEMTPAEIAEELAKSGSTIRSLLTAMAEEKLLCKKGRGRYALASSLQTKVRQEDLFEEETDY